VPKVGNIFCDEYNETNPILLSHALPLTMGQIFNDLLSTFRGIEVKLVILRGRKRKLTTKLPNVVRLRLDPIAPKLIEVQVCQFCKQSAHVMYKNTFSDGSSFFIDEN
jgi:hypothetical protein